MIHHVQPVTVLHLFPVLDHKLITLLRSLKEDDWTRSTICKPWTVKDMAAHLADGNLRTISVVRDGYRTGPDTPLTSYQDMMDYGNNLNAEWITASRRLSPMVVTNLLEKTGNEFIRVLSGLDPWEESPVPAGWTGEEAARNWLYVARAYTEKWLHQQQIREAVGAEGLLAPELFTPFMETVMCALPFAYKQVEAPVGTSVMVRVVNGLASEWHINKTEEGWVLRRETRVTPDAIIELDADTAWKLFSKGISAEEAGGRIQITGDAELARAALGMVKVVA